MDEKIYVIGHKNPDTDSVCAAIAYAHLKKKSGHLDVVACSAGRINKETTFVLETFQAPAPLSLEDVDLRVRDLPIDSVPTIRDTLSLKEAWQIMQETRQKTLPVVDENGHLLGVVTIGDLSEAYFKTMGSDLFRALEVPLENVLSTLDGKLLTGDPKKSLKGAVYVGAMEIDTMDKVVPDKAIVLMGDRRQAQERALQHRLTALILTGGAVLDEPLLERARAMETAVFTVEYDTFTAARLLPMSIPVSSILTTRSPVAFHEDDLLQEVKQKMLENRFRNYPVLDDHGRVMGFISRYHLLKVGRKKLILVDHNEWGQAIQGAQQAEILEVVDHHRVGGIQTGEPIVFRTEPVGSTCTIIAKCYLDREIVPNKTMAGLMLSAILSDTVLFKSPTCTMKDREMAAYLEKLAEVDAMEYGRRMFQAGSDVADMSAEDIIESDFKAFDVGPYRIGIGQLSHMGTSDLDQLQKNLQKQMKQQQKQRGLHYLLLMLTDLLEESTRLFITGKHPERIAEAFDQPYQEGYVDLPRVLSRKKQIVPVLVRHLTK